MCPLKSPFSCVCCRLELYSPHSDSFFPLCPDLVLQSLCSKDPSLLLCVPFCLFRLLPRKCFKCVTFAQPKWSDALFPCLIYPFPVLSFGRLLTPWPVLAVMSPDNCWWCVALNEAHLLQRVGNLGATMSLQHLTGGAPRAEAAPLPQNFRIPVETGELILTGPFWVMKENSAWLFAMPDTTYNWQKNTSTNNLVVLFCLKISDYKHKDI